VAYLLADEKVVGREFGAFESVKDHYPKYVLSLDKFDFSQNGIKHLNIIDFLLA
jgi:predicted AAA+ superfamily ATPase